MFGEFDWSLHGELVGLADVELYGNCDVGRGDNKEPDGHLEGSSHGQHAGELVGPYHGDGGRSRMLALDLGRRWSLGWDDRLLLGLLVLGEGAQGGDLLPLAACRRGLRTGLQEVQRLARLFCFEKEKVRLLPGALKS